MKILYINGSRIPTERAHGLQIMKMCEALSRNTKHATRNNITTVELWIPRRFNHVQRDPFEYYSVKRSFEIRRFFCIDLVPCDRFLGPAAFWVTELSFLLFVTCFALFCKSDIVYTRDKFVAFLLSFFRKKIFFEAHDLPSKIFFLGFRRAKGIIVITQNLKEEFVRRGIKEHKILVAPDGVDLNEFDIQDSREYCREKFHLPIDKRIVLYTGHLYPWKGAALLLGAARKSQISNLKFQNTLFVFVGGTKKEAENYQLQVTSYKLQNVRIIGHRPHKEIPYWLKAADVLVLPNSAKYGISKYWTSPLKLFEYMASGRPIIASSLPSTREVLSSENSILIEPDSADALANALMYVFKDQFLRDRVSLRAKEDVKSYTWEIRVKNILEFVRNAHS